MDDKAKGDAHHKNEAEARREAVITGWRRCSGHTLEEVWQAYRDTKSKVAQPWRRPHSRRRPPTWRRPSGWRRPPSPRRPPRWRRPPRRPTSRRRPPRWRGPPIQRTPCINLIIYIYIYFFYIGEDNQVSLYSLNLYKKNIYKNGIFGTLY